jgi:hypothetical protein
MPQARERDESCVAYVSMEDARRLQSYEFLSKGPISFTRLNRIFVIRCSACNSAISGRSRRFRLRVWCRTSGRLYLRFSMWLSLG